MKKFILFFAVVFFTISTSFAQEESQGLKGASWGLLAFSYSDSEASNISSFSILPAYGKFITPDITIGGAIGLVSTTIGDADATTTIVVKPLVRKYWSATPTFYIFGEANAPMLFGDGFKGYGFNIDLGIDYFIGGKWTIEAKFGRFGYNIISPDEGESTGTTSFGLNMFDAQTQENLGGGMSLGLKYLL